MGGWVGKTTIRPIGFDRFLVRFSSNDYAENKYFCFSLIKQSALIVVEATFSERQNLCLVRP